MFGGRSSSTNDLGVALDRLTALTDKLEVRDMGEMDWKVDESARERTVERENREGHRFDVFLSFSNRIKTSMALLSLSKDAFLLP